ncbi:mannan endo-1,4-beta-mannosidase [Porphyromonadaceae bacterium KH3R12]|nr:mannan endo-1,4-beta-mannosidase [Porphyromonadaceae bacterium KH3R12]
MRNVFFYVLLVLCFGSSCKGEDAVDPPVFLYTRPDDKSVDVPLNQEVSVGYDTEIVLADNHGITVNNEKANVTANSRKLLFSLTLETGTTYDIVIPEGAVRNNSGGKAAAARFSFTTISDNSRYEAEKATLTGNAAIENTLGNYSGSGYVNQKEGDLVFKVNVPKSGRYEVLFRYANDNQRKENDLWVNDVKLSSIVFDATYSWKNNSMNIFFREGTNTLAIKKNWGWTYYDYIEINPAPEATPFNISTDLVTASPSKEAMNLYNFLKENFGKKVISGAMANYSTGIEEARWMYDNTGKWPALACFDLINYTTSWGVGDYTEMTANVEDWWDNNGIVSIMWHWRDPLKKTDAFYTEGTSFDISKITDPNSDEYKAMIDDIDAIAGYLKQFKEKNIPVLWRPLHEASGGWFWWGAKGAAPCKALWKLMFDRLVDHHQLNNLIWVWTSDASDSAVDWYPGDAYVDVIGMDIYPGENQHGSQYVNFDRVKALFESRKILALSECGSIPSVEAMFEYGDIWSWVMPWNGNYTRDDKHNGATFLNSFLNSDKVITRDGMPGLR